MKDAACVCIPTRRRPGVTTPGWNSKLEIPRSGTASVSEMEIIR